MSASVALSSTATNIASRENDAEKKMCWAHAVAWAFDMQNAYEKPDVMLSFNDAPFGNPKAQTDAGKWSFTKTQIKWAQKYGVNGLMVDCPVVKSSVKIMGRYFDAAKELGTNFKVAICYDGLGWDEPAAIEAICDFMKKYGDHSNAAYIDGRHVIFLYNSDTNNAAGWKRIFEQVRKRGYNPFFFGRGIFEVLTTRPVEELEQLAEAFDGFYDFGCSGILPDVMKSRLKIQRDALDKASKKTGKKKLLCASIAPGYNERRTAFYRPYLGSRTMRDNWNAALANKADWVSLTTWDDYGESTNFEPSQNIGDAPLVLNQYYLDLWRGKTPAKNSSPDAIIAYKPDIVDGCDFTIDVSLLPHEGTPALFYAKVTDLQGNVIANFEPIKTNPASLVAQTLRIEDANLKDVGDMRVQVAIEHSDKKAEEIQWKELKVATRRVARPLSYAPYKARFSKTSNVGELKLSINGNKKSKIASLVFSKNAKGRLELLRNSRVFASQNIDVKAGEEIQIPLSSRNSARSDVYQARLAYDDFYFTNSNAEQVVMPAYKKSRMVETPVVVLNSSFDENSQLWDIPQRRSPEKVETRNVDLARVFSVRFDFEEKSGNPVASKRSWNIQTKLGAERLRSRRKNFDAPSRMTDFISGKEKGVLSFSGKEALTFENNSSPQGIVTVEMLIKPTKTGKTVPLFSDWRTYFISLDEDGFAILDCFNTKLKSTMTIGFNEWTHLAAVIAGDKMMLYVNGLLAGEASYKPEAKYLGNAPIFGNLENVGFVGMLDSISIEAVALKPEKFKLLKILKSQ